MFRNGENANAPGRKQVQLMPLLALGLYGMALGEAIQLALRLWPGTMSNDLAWYPLLFGLFCVLLASLLILVSLLILKVHWLLVIGVLSLSLLASYVQGRLFPADVSYWITYWFLTYGGVVVVLSLILLGRVKGIWPALWRTMLVAGVGAAIPIAVMIVRGPVDWVDPQFGRPIILMSLVVGALIPIVGYWFTKRVREHSFQA